MPQCVYGADEAICGPKQTGSASSEATSKPMTVYMKRVSYHSGKVTFMLRGEPSASVSWLPIPPGQLCPSSHFSCPNSESLICLPAYLRCNGVTDCQRHEDESDCGHYMCPGFYRCRNSKICLHTRHVCDGIYGQCPQSDDEWACEVHCPADCICHGHAYFCNQSFFAGNHTHIRYLNADRSNMTLTALENNTMLIHLSLTRCFLHRLSMPLLPNLHSLDLSDNHVNNLSPDSFRKITNLRVLFLARNPLDLYVSISAITSLINLEELDLSFLHIPELNLAHFKEFSHLHMLNLSHTELIRVQGTGFLAVRSLKSLDLTDCPLLQFPHDLFQGLDQLRMLIASNYKMCCPAILPENFNPAWCTAPFDELSSCEDLLRNNIYRAGLTVLATFSLLGNCASFLFRTLFDKSVRSHGFGVFVMHLSFSDFLMGIYLLVIGVADSFYHGIYMWNDLTWKGSLGCSTAGVLSLVSSEVSALLISLITVDRFLVLRFPFSHVHFTPKSAHIASTALWMTGLGLSVIPLLPITSHWQFYSQTGLCIPLPITSTGFAGHDFSFGVFICLNFVLFLLIAVGQGFIYWSVRSNAMRNAGTAGESSNVTIARRLITVVVSDFLCWFPIGVLGLMAARGSQISGEVNVAMAIFVLPLNSALNPFLYTVNVIREHKRHKREKHLMSFLSKTLYGDVKHDLR